MFLEEQFPIHEAAKLWYWEVMTFGQKNLDYLLILKYEVLPCIGKISYYSLQPFAS